MVLKAEKPHDRGFPGSRPWDASSMVQFMSEGLRVRHLLKEMLVQGWKTECRRSRWCKPGVQRLESPKVGERERERERSCLVYSGSQSELVNLALA